MLTIYNSMHRSVETRCSSSILARIATVCVHLLCVRIGVHLRIEADGQQASVAYIYT